MRQTAFLLSVFTFFSIIFSCTEPNPIGAELLEEDQANLSFSNTIPVSAKTVAGAPIPSYSPFVTFQLGNYLLGEVDDPDFGKSTASIYSQVSRNFEAPFIAEGLTIDSIILSINYDPLNSIGDFSEPLNLEVYRLQEDLFNTSDYTSDQTFMIGDNLIGEGIIFPSFTDSIDINDYVSETDSTITTRYPAHIRIPLTEELARELLDTNLYVSDSVFINVFKGIYIEPVTSNGGLASFNFNSAISRITLYYRASEEPILYEYRYPFTIGNARNSLLIHDTAGAAIDDAIDNEDSDFLYLQSMAGSNIEINFPDVSELENVVVNKAELELTVAINSLDTVNFPPVPQIAALNLRDDELDVIDDVLAAILSNTPINTSVFGGNPVVETTDGVSLIKYRINLSSYFQDLLEGNLDPTILLTAGSTQNAFYLPIPPKGGQGNVVTIFGPNHPEYAPKLNLIFTDL